MSEHPVRNTTIGVGLVAVLAFLFGPKLGFGAGSGIVPAFNQQAEQPQAQVQQAEPSAEPAAKPDGNRITIENDVIYYMGNPVTIDELREQIVPQAKEGEIMLENNQAIKGAYDAVTALLAELGMTYSEAVQ